MADGRSVPSPASRRRPSRAVGARGPRSRAFRAPAWGTAALAAALAPAPPAAATAATVVEVAEEAAVAPEDGCRRALFPKGHIFQPYLADPGRSGFALVYGSYGSSDVEAAGDSRVLVRLGGIYGFFGRRCADGRRPWQVDFSAGFLGQFDLDSSLDSLAWDGFYSLMFTWGRSDAWSFRAGFLHDSAHLGDEFVEETGRQRINYTREEVLVAASWASAGWRLYAEGGLPYSSGDDDVQGDLRLQAGIEWLGPTVRHWSATRWYAALDTEALETRDYELRATLQTGVVLARNDGDELYRFGVEATTGPSVLGEFVLEDETYVGLGMWFDI